jgi:predicted patatin/cPLA2 family phospholipase
MIPRPSIGLALFVAVLSLLTACAGVPRFPVPAQLVDKAHVLGSEIQVRWWGDAAPRNLNKMAQERYDQIKATRPSLTASQTPPAASFLAISGGGADGAFTAGLLVGWTASGNRPQFELVTGVSTGALAAPFAFLGPKYDPQLREIYTRYSTRDLLRKQPLRGLLGGASLADSAPLAQMIARYVDASLLTEIAAQHRRGRRLLVGTTNIDAQRSVIWDMGRIAASGHPASLDLFRKVLLASASIPGAFPPVRITVDVEGSVLEEQHVDGGTTKQVFLLPGQLTLKTAIDQQYRVERRRRLYIIRNGRIKPEYKVVELSTLSIAQRSISTLIKGQGIGDLYQIYELTKRNDISYNLAFIPGNFPDTSTEPFDPEYMTALFDLGFEKGKAGYKWAKAPPGLNQQTSGR